MSIQAIPTHYIGRHFRSRLEARWAAFFYALGIKFDYEPEAYALASGNYLPDFYIPKQANFPDPIWFEVKPEGSLESVTRFDDLLVQSRTRGAVLRSIPDREYDPDSETWWICQPVRDSTGQWGLGADFQYRFCDCPNCSAIGFTFQGRAARIPCNCNSRPYDGKSDSKNYRDWTPKLKRAYALALSMRFDGLEGL